MLRDCIFVIVCNILYKWKNGSGKMDIDIKYGIFRKYVFLEYLISDKNCLINFYRLND